MYAFIKPDFFQKNLFLLELFQFKQRRHLLHIKVAAFDQMFVYKRSSAWESEIRN